MHSTWQNHYHKFVFVDVTSFQSNVGTRFDLTLFRSSLVLMYVKWSGEEGGLFLIE